MFKLMRAAPLLLATLAVAGCASAPGRTTNKESFEGFNRGIYKFNDTIDKAALKPVAKGYRKVTPQFVRTGIGNVLSNLEYPGTFINQFLQGKVVLGLKDTGRFLLNSTLGVAGIFDVATDWGMPSRPRDFGETMGTYGVPPGPYLVLPFRGSTDVRDFAGNYLDGYATPLRYVRYDGRNYVGLMKSTLGSINNRANNLVTYRDIERASVDYYATMRTWYMERRARLIEDTPVRTAELPDF